MSDTPRTDAEETVYCEDEMCVPISFARQLERELAAAIKQRDEAHRLIRKWRINLMDVVDDGEIMYAMTSDGRCSMDDADKRAFLEATQKKGGGA